MSSDQELAERAAYLLDYLELALDKLQKMSANGAGEYLAFVHGQIYGIAMALKILFPGPGNWGEKAAFKVRPVLTEHKCECNDKEL